MSLDDYFSTGPTHERPVFDAVMAGLADIGPVVVEPLSVGIFLKRARTFAELRPMQRWVALSFSLPGVVRHPLITRKPIAHGGGWYHVVNISEPSQLDDRIVGWLIDAYDRCPS